MSIASEISALQADRTSIQNAINAKGGSASSSDGFDDFATLIADIPQGQTPTGTKQISVTQNGTQTENVSGYASAQLNVAVPNSYSQSDEGKVVSNGALVAQTSDTVTTNDTYDTTLINSLTVNVSGGGGSLPSNVADIYEVTLASTATNALALVQLILTGITIPTGHFFAIFLVNKPKANFVNNQMFEAYGDIVGGSITGAMGRWRNGWSYGVIGASYDATAEIGDTFIVLDLDGGVS